MLSFAGTECLQMSTSYSRSPWRSFFLTMVRQTSGTVNFFVFDLAAANLSLLPPRRALHEIARDVRDDLHLCIKRGECALQVPVPAPLRMHRSLP